MSAREASGLALQHKQCIHMIFFTKKNAHMYIYAWINTHVYVFPITPQHGRSLLFKSIILPLLIQIQQPTKSRGWIKDLGMIPRFSPSKITGKRSHHQPGDTWTELDRSGMIPWSRCWYWCRCKMETMRWCLHRCKYSIHLVNLSKSRWISLNLQCAYKALLDVNSKCRSGFTQNTYY